MLKNGQDKTGRDVRNKLPKGTVRFFGKAANLPPTTTAYSLRLSVAMIARHDRHLRGEVAATALACLAL